MSELIGFAAKGTRYDGYVKPWWALVGMTVREVEEASGVTVHALLSPSDASQQYKDAQPEDRFESMTQYIVTGSGEAVVRFLGLRYGRNGKESNNNHY